MPVSSINAHGLLSKLTNNVSELGRDVSQLHEMLNYFANQLSFLSSIRQELENELVTERTALHDARQEIIELRSVILMSKIRTISDVSRTNKVQDQVMEHVEVAKVKKPPTDIKVLKERVARVKEMTKCSHEQAVIALHNNDDDLKRAVAYVFEHSWDGLGGYFNSKSFSSRLPEWVHDGDADEWLMGSKGEKETDKVVFLEDHVVALKAAEFGQPDDGVSHMDELPAADRLTFPLDDLMLNHTKPMKYDKFLIKNYSSPNLCNQ